MSHEIIRKLASRVLRAEVAARNAKDVNATIDAISTRIRFDDQGDIYVVDKNGTRDDRKSFETFLEEVKVDRPDLFRGGPSSNNRGSENPWIKGPNFSITNQMFILNSNPELAAEYKSEAEQTK